MTDDMIRALAKNGGVIGINFGEGFLNPKDAELLKRAVNTISNEPALTGKALDDYAGKQFQEEFANPRHSFATIDDAVAHIDHAVKLAGIDHVGIGSDFDGVPALPRELPTAETLPRVTECLQERGVSDADIEKILGGNFLRAFEAIESSRRG